MKIIKQRIEQHLPRLPFGNKFIRKYLKLLNTRLLLFKERKIWFLPNKCDVLIFDSRGDSLMEVELAKVLSPYGTIGRLVFPGNGEINIPVLLASILKRGTRITAYCDSYIRRTNPRVVISCIDNSTIFYSVAVRNPDVKSIFLQNGTRAYFSDVFEKLDRKPSGENMKVDFMLVFGSNIGAEYAKYVAGSVVPIGSFKNNNIPRVRPKVEGTLSFISQYRDVATRIERNGILYTHQQWFESLDQMIIPFLASYAKDKGLQFRIIPRAGHQKDSSILRNEKRYFRGILGSECEFSKWERHGSSYDDIDSTEVAVTIDSSLGLEAIARGTKSAIFSIRSTIIGHSDPYYGPYKNYGWPGCYLDEGPFWTNNFSTATFRRILDHLFTVSDEQWRAELEQHGFQEVMQYDPGNSKLRAILANELR